MLFLTVAILLFENERIRPPLICVINILVIYFFSEFTDLLNNIENGCAFNFKLFILYISTLLYYIVFIISLIIGTLLSYLVSRRS